MQTFLNATDVHKEWGKFIDEVIRIIHLRFIEQAKKAEKRGQLLVVYSEPQPQPKTNECCLIVFQINNRYLLPAALLVFLAAAAGTGIITANFFAYYLLLLGFWGKISAFFSKFLIGFLNI